MKNGSQDQKKIFVLEDHSAIGGLGDRLLNTLTEIGEIIGPTSSGKDRTSPGQAKEFNNLGLKEYPECGTPLEVLEFHKLDGKSLAKRISGKADIGSASGGETEEKVKQKIDIGFIDSFKPYNFKNIEKDLQLIYERK